MATSDIPAPLVAGRLCPDCKGTGADIPRTQRRAAGNGYVRCWSCNGNGLDPAEYFTWTRKDS